MFFQSCLCFKIILQKKCPKWRPIVFVMRRCVQAKIARLALKWFWNREVLSGILIFSSKILDLWRPNDVYISKRGTPGFQIFFFYFYGFKNVFCKLGQFFSPFGRPNTDFGFVGPKWCICNIPYQERNPGFRRYIFLYGFKNVFYKLGKFLAHLGAQSKILGLWRPNDVYLTKHTKKGTPGFQIFF